MHPDLSPHLHTEECNKLIKELNDCHRVHNIAQFWGKCNGICNAMLRCLKKERLAKREANYQQSLKNQEIRKQMRKADTTNYKELFPEIFKDID